MAERATLTNGIVSLGTVAFNPPSRGGAGDAGRGGDGGGGVATRRVALAGVAKLALAQDMEAPQVHSLLVEPLRCSTTCGPGERVDIYAAFECATDYYDALNEFLSLEGEGGAVAARAHAKSAARAAAKTSAAVAASVVRLGAGLGGRLNQQLGDLAGAAGTRRRWRPRAGSRALTAPTSPTSPAPPTPASTASGGDDVGGGLGETARGRSPARSRPRRRRDSGPQDAGGAERATRRGAPRRGRGAAASPSAAPSSTTFTLVRSDAAREMLESRAHARRLQSVAAAAGSLPERAAAHKRHAPTCPLRRARAAAAAAAAAAGGAALLPAAAPLPP